MLGHQPRHRIGHVPAFQDWSTAIAGKGIHDRQGAEATSIKQRIAHEVHAPQRIGGAVATLIG